MSFQKSRTRTKWATDACIIPEFNKICIATGDREILFYELSSLASYCQVAKLPGIPISLCFANRDLNKRKKGDNKIDEGVFIFGDTNGYVHILSLNNP